jgi:clan AA aspartic protease
MISGSVNERCEAIVGLVVHGPDGQRLEVDSVVDTGYNGFFTLPAMLVADLDLPFLRQGYAELADGQEVLLEVYEGTVLWDGKPRRVSIDVADTDPLLGMALLYGHKLTIEVAEGGSVLISELPRS